jgi:hypothetical protein
MRIGIERAFLSKSIKFKFIAGLVKETVDYMGAVEIKLAKAAETKRTPAKTAGMRVLAAAPLKQEVVDRYWVRRLAGCALEANVLDPSDPKRTQNAQQHLGKENLRHCISTGLDERQQRRLVAERGQVSGNTPESQYSP